MTSRPSLTQSTIADISIELATASIHNTITDNHSLLSSESVEESKSMTALLYDLSSIDSHLSFANNGYKKISKICDTQQGDLYKAIEINESSNNSPTNYVAIKRTEKRLFKKGIAVEDDITFCVSSDCIKESEILRYLTVNNKPIGNYIVQWIDFFETDDAYYLVMEHVASDTNIQQFISQAKQHTKSGELSMKQYQKMVKYLLWQLFVTIQWLHISMKCCHLNLCAENILVENANFIETKDGMVIDGNISIKLCDFAVSEIFDTNSFICDKQPLSLNDAYLAPQVFNEEKYDARAADNWKLGIILFECITGKRLYEALDIHMVGSGFGYWAIANQQLKTYLKVNNLLNYFNIHSFDVLNALLNVDEAQRLNGMNILKHSWFNMYYNRYKKQISKKFSKNVFIY